MLFRGTGNALRDPQAGPEPGQYPLPADFGALLRFFRQRQGLTQEQLALAVFGNRRKSTIGELENDTGRVPYPRTLRELATALELSSAERSSLTAASAQRSAARPGGQPPSQPEPAQQNATPLSRKIPAPRLSMDPPLNLLGDASAPTFLTEFIGRQTELDQAVALITKRTNRVVTITGPGGTGKTRLACEVARRVGNSYHDGVAYVGLDGVDRPDGVIDEIARVLRAPDQLRVDAVENLARAIGSRHILLLLDNFEQVASAAGHLARLISTVPNLQLLVTSRVSLNIRGEVQYRLPPMGLPKTHSGEADDILSSDAVQLFFERAKSRHDVELTYTTVTAVAAICKMLDGIPLALELAAARTSLLEPAAMASRLEKGLDFLGSGPRDSPERQHTLRATLEWSYRLLDSEEKLALEEMAVFAGDWSLDTAESFCSATAAIDTVAGLLDKNMVIPRPGNRFRILRIVREFALERLSERDVVDGVRRRFISWAIQQVELATGRIRADRDQNMGHVVDSGALLEAEGPNFTAALQYALEDGLQEELAALIGPLADLWVPLGQYRLLKRWVYAVDQTQVSLERLAFVERAAAAVALFSDADPAATIVHAQRSADAFARLGLISRVGGMRATAAHAMRQLGRYAEAEVEFSQLISEQEALSEPTLDLQQLEYSYALILTDLGRTVEAEPMIREYVTHCGQQHNIIAAADSTAVLAAIVARDGRKEEASLLLQRVIPALENGEITDAEYEVDAFIGASVVAVCLGETAVAIEWARSAIVRIDVTGYRLALGDALSILGAATAYTDDPERALHLLAAGHAARKPTGVVMLGRVARTIVDESVALLRSRLTSTAYETVWRRGNKDSNPVAMALGVRRA